jgi:ABC-type branched-subunit amino acid transport system ATPase component
VLDVVAVSTGYGKARAVDGVSLNVPRGSVVAVLGPNGAGKTTLLRAICGDLRLWAGRVVLDGQDLAGLGSDERAVRGVTMCPEGRRILSTLTVEENLRIGATALLRRAPRARRRQLLVDGLEQAFSRFPVLRQRQSSFGGALSGGQQQMLAIARSLMSNPSLLLLDEPSLGLAPLVIDEVYALLEVLRRDGLTMVLVEESSTRALDFASSAVVIRNGRVLLSGTAATVKSDPEFANAFLGERAVSHL